MAVPPASANPVSNISMESFLKILTTQLSHQDPLKPMDNQEFITQMAQFASLEQTREMNTQLGQLLSLQSSTQSVGMLGKKVDFNKQDGSAATGTVTALAFSNGVPTMTITTSTAKELGVTFGQLVQVSQ